MISNQFKELYKKTLKSADTLSGVRVECRDIQDRIKQIQLPKLSISEMNDLKEHLIEWKKNPDPDIKYKFLNLRDEFLIINEMEDDTKMLDKIYPIIQWLKTFNYVFKLIRQNQGKKDPETELALQTLDFEIRFFTNKYHRMLTDTDITNIGFRDMTEKQVENFEDEQEEEEIIEETTPEEYRPEYQPEENNEINQTSYNEEPE